MTKVWIVEGDHHVVPGLVVKVCASKTLADLEAVALVKIILHDLGGGQDVTIDNWEESLEAAKVEYADHYNEMPRVEISEHDVIGDPL
jgi:hypothetical protein